MNETKAIADLPHMTIEIRHQELEDENAELLTINVKASPDLQSVANWLDPMTMWQTQLANPFAMWQQTMAAVWSPWLALYGLSTSSSLPKRETLSSLEDRRTNA